MDIFVHYSKFYKTIDVVKNSSSFGLVLIGFTEFNTELILDIINELQFFNLKSVSALGENSELDLACVEALLSSFDLEYVIFVYNL